MLLITICKAMLHGSGKNIAENLMKLLQVILNLLSMELAKLDSDLIGMRQLKCQENPMNMQDHMQELLQEKQFR